MADQTTFPGVEFECRVLIGFQCVDRLVTTSESEALTWAEAQVSPIVSQVSIEASLHGDVSTFAMRYLSPDRHGAPVMTQWTCWRDGTRVATTSLDRLFDGITARTEVTA